MSAVGGVAERVMVSRRPRSVSDAGCVLRSSSPAVVAEGLTVSAHWRHRQAHVRISGCFDGSGVGRAAQLLLLSAQHARQLNLDLAGVRRLGPLGMQLLFDTGRTAAASGCTLLLRRASPPVVEALHGTGWFGAGEISGRDSAGEP